MSKRRRHESPDILPGSSTEPSGHEELPPLTVDLPPLNPIEMTINPIVPLETLSSPQHEALSDLTIAYPILDSTDFYDAHPVKLEVASSSVSHINDGINANDPPVSATEPNQEAIGSQPHASSVLTQIFADQKHDAVSCPQVNFEVEAADSFCIEGGLGGNSFLNPSGSGTKPDQEENTCQLSTFFDGDFVFFDAVDSEVHLNHHFQEDCDPFQFNEDNEEESASPTSEFVSELFYDALDTEPLPDSDLPKSDPPLYKGATITVSEALFAVLTFLLGCRISGEVLKHLINLINLLLPACHNFVTSVFTFYKYFQHIRTSLNLIYYCTICTQNLAAKDSICDKCTTGTRVGFYIHAPLIDQLRSLYARPGFVDLLSYRHTRTKKFPNNIEDIYDGSLYKSIEGFLTSVLDITLTWNADGISLYKSSSFQVWPMYFSINELPPEERYKEENLILGGLAFGYEKPHINILLKPIYEEFKCLEKGVDVLVHGRDIPENAKCFLLGGTADAPAKALFMRMTQFNGHHGCHCCYAKGEKSDRTGQVFVYPFQEDIMPRSREAYCEDLNNVKNGIKGPSYLFYMVKSFFMLSTAIDVMHCVYLGVCRQLFGLWFSTEFFKLVFGENVDKKPLQDVLSQIFCSFRAPHYLDRPPRSLKHIHYFKASEFRTWLYSTALPVFQMYMKEPYLSHFKKLVCGVSILNQDSVSPSNVQLARDILTSFVKQFQELYGLRNMSYNVHCLLHLADTVLWFGPLWVSSCFPYENINGILSKLVHGTRYAGCQIQSNLGLLRKIPSMIKSLKNIAVKNYCTQVMSYRRTLSVTLQLASKTFIVGKILREYTFSNPSYLDFIRNKFPQSQLNFFFRLKKDGFLYVAEEYGRGIRDSSNVICTVSSDQKIFGSVKVFFRVTTCKCLEPICNHPSCNYALIQRYSFSYPFKVQNPVATIFTIVNISPIDEMMVVDISGLNFVCFKMCTEKSNFLSMPLNSREME